MKSRRSDLNVRILLITILVTFLFSCNYLAPSKKVVAPPTEKFKNFTFIDACTQDKNQDPILSEIKSELATKETVLDLLKFYSDELSKDISTESPYFVKLQRIFECGVTPESMTGYLHGAVVAFRNEGFLKVFDINTLNLKWPLARFFSPWTGKTFEPIDIEKLRYITDNYEKGETSTFWGANTYSTRRPNERMAVDVMKSVGIHLEKASDAEVAAHNYDVKGFFFIARKGRSVNQTNHGKMVFQFNYRWPKLKTFPPDNYCIDEIVQIADGLYLGQLNYATNLSLSYDPTLPPEIYKVKNFGYFLLMDDEWQSIREKIHFDVILSHFQPPFIYKEQ